MAKKFVVVPGLGVVAADPADRKPLKNGCPMVMRDIQPFKSVVDGSIVGGRASLRQHNTRNRVVDMREMEGTWKEAAKKREAIANGTSDKKERIEALKHAVEVHRK